MKYYSKIEIFIKNIDDFDKEKFIPQDKFTLENINTPLEHLRTQQNLLFLCVL